MLMPFLYKVIIKRCLCGFRSYFWVRSDLVGVQPQSAGAPAARDPLGSAGPGESARPRAHEAALALHPPLMFMPFWGGGGESSIVVCGGESNAAV